MSGGIGRRAFLKTSLLAAGALSAHGQIVAGPKDPGSNGAARTEHEFLDPRIVEHTYFLERTVSPVRRPLPDPIFRDSDVATVLPKPEGGLSMWYVRLVPRPGAQDFNYVLCYAESDDGSVGTCPSLGLNELDGNKRNNVLITPNDRDANGRPLTGFYGPGLFCVLDAKLTPHPKARAQLHRDVSLQCAQQRWSERGLLGGRVAVAGLSGEPRLSRLARHREQHLLRPATRSLRVVLASVRSGCTPALRTSTAWFPAPKATIWFTGTASASCSIPTLGCAAAGTIKDGGPSGCYPRGRDRQFYGHDRQAVCQLIPGPGAPCWTPCPVPTGSRCSIASTASSGSARPERTPFLAGS